MWDLQHIISIWRRRYWQIFKSALVYLLLFLFYFGFFFFALAFWQIRDCWFQIYQKTFKFIDQNTKIRHFWCHFLLLLLPLLLFCSIFVIWINSRVLTSNMTLAFSNFSLKILKKTFLVQIYEFLFLYKILHFDKFEGTNFKYLNKFSYLQHKITQIRHFWFKV